MARVFLTIWTFSVLLVYSAGAQIRTGVGAQPTPSPAPNVAKGRATATRQAPANTSPAAQPGKQSNRAPKKDPRIAAAPAPPQSSTPAGPPAPPPAIPQVSRPADMPPVPPQITYRNGMLTVNAPNSTMGSVLNAIRSKTGIEFEGAENSGERVAVSLGPAPEGEVLAGIFSGSGFDYVVLGRADAPDIVQRVILTPKKGGAVNAANQPPQAQQQAQQEGEEDVPDETANAPDADPQNQDTAAQPPPTQPQQPAQQQPNENPQQQGGPKTPEQLLQELKQMQLQQQQQGQPPPDTNSVPRKPPM